MRIVTRNNLFLSLIIIAAALLIVKITEFYFNRTRTAGVNDRQVIHSLPDDVEYVLEGYKYSEISDEMKIAVSGKRVIRRGREILGLRSNLVKTNYFEDIRGTLRAKTAVLTFAASAAEWNAIASQPFILRKGVTITINGKRLRQVTSARLYFKQGVLEVDGDRTERYLLK